MINPRIFDFFKLVAAEHERAVAAHGPMHSPHEAYGVIYEELVEFFGEVRQKNNSIRKYAMLMELVQIAAMCMRAAIDLLLIDEVPREYILNRVEVEVDG